MKLCSAQHLRTKVVALLLFHSFPSISYLPPIPLFYVSNNSQFHSQIKTDISGKKMSCDDMSCRLKLVRRLHPLQPDALLPFSLHLMISLCIQFFNKISIEQLIVEIVVVWIFLLFQISSLLETSNATHPPGVTYRSSLIMALILTKCYKCIILLRNVHVYQVCAIILFVSWEV